MKNIIKNKSNLNFLNKSLEQLDRSSAVNQTVGKKNAELLRLYRDVLKMTQRFTWANEDGTQWKTILQKSSRQEFEMMRKETDSVKVAQFMLTWKDAIMRIHDKVNETQMKIMKHVDESRTDKELLQRNQYDEKIV
eukprot:403347456